MENQNSIKGMHSIRTMSSSKKSSFSNETTSNHLNLYMMDKEMTRLLMEKKRLSIRLEAINNRIRDIEDFKKHAQEHDIKTNSTNQDDWKVQKLNY